MRNTRIWIVLGALAVLVIAGVVVGIMVWPSDEVIRAAEKATPKSIAGLPAPADQTPEQTVVLLASEEFDGLSQEKKEAYFEQVLAAGEARGDDGRAGMRAFFQAAREMDEEQQGRLRENGRQLGMMAMERQLDKYFAMSREEKNAILDERIDRMQQWRERRSDGQEGSGGGGGGRRGGRHGGLTPERLLGIIEHVSPVRRAKFEQFHKDMRDRMEERGIDSGH